MNRIDREIIKKNMNCINKSNGNNNSFKHSDEYFDKHKYKPLEFYNNLHLRNRLYTNGNLLTSNKSKRNNNRIVYAINQNTVDF